MTATARAGAVLIADRGGLCLDATMIMVFGGTRVLLGAKKHVDHIVSTFISTVKMRLSCNKKLTFIA